MITWPGPEFDDVDLGDEPPNSDAGALPFHQKPKPQHTSKPREREAKPKGKTNAKESSRATR